MREYLKHKSQGDRGIFVKGTAWRSRQRKVRVMMFFLEPDLGHRLSPLMTGTLLCMSTRECKYKATCTYKCVINTVCLWYRRCTHEQIEAYVDTCLYVQVFWNHYLAKKQTNKKKRTSMPISRHLGTRNALIFLFLNCNIPSRNVIGATHR